MQSRRKMQRRSVLRNACQYGIEALESRTLLNAADLDTTFGTGGVAELTLTGFAKDIGTATAVQSDGKTIVVGSAQGINQFMIAARFNANGNLDSSFGTAGEAVIPVQLWSQANAVAIQTDGKIVLAGYGGNSGVDGSPKYPAVARLLPNGQLDTTFNATGTEFIETTTLGEIDSIAIQSNGKIVLGGWTSSASSSQNFTIARVNSTGGLDSTFGTSGITVTPVALSSIAADKLAGLAIDSTGNIIAAGPVGTLSAPKFGVVRYTTAGALDTTFGTGGITQSNFTGRDLASGVALQSDGKIVVAGFSNNSFTAARYSTTGAIDSTFGTSGRTTITTGTDVCVGLVIQPTTGSITLAGYGSRSGSLVCLVDRLTSTGALDTTFNTTGKVTAGVAGQLMGGVALLSSGGVAVTGYNNVSQNLSTFQFTSAGVLDSTFGSSGAVVTDFTVPVKASAAFVKTTTDGKIVTAGPYSAGSTVARNGQVFVARYNANGTPDASFAINGIAKRTIGRLASIFTMLVQANGDIIVGGNTGPVGSTAIHAYVVRFLPNGTIDTTFGVNGQQDFSMLSGNTFLSGFLAKSDGSFSAVVEVGASSAILHLTSNGQVDGNFGGGTGVVTTTQAYGVAAIDSSDRIVAIVDGATHIDRLLSTGAIDTTFNYTNAPSDLIAAGGSDSLACQPDGKILVVGQGSTDIERYTATGARDTSFNGNGFAHGPGAGDQYFSVEVQPDGTMFAVGTRSEVSGTAAEISEFDSSGHLVTAFGNAGSAYESAAGSATSFGDVTVNNGKIVASGFKDLTAALVQFVGNPQNVINGTVGADTITLVQDADHLHIDWSGIGQAGKVAINDPAGLTIYGNGGADTISLVNTNGSPFPNIMHLNGLFTVNGLQTTGNPLASTTLDINSSTLFITYASPSVDPIAAIKSALKTGYNGGAWTGTAVTGSIRSTTAAAAPLQFSIGYADFADVANPAGLPTNTIKLRYTAIGDVNLDGTVGLTDLTTLLQNYTAGSRWDQGDITYDGTVGLADLTLLLQDFNQSATSPSAAPAETSPTKRTRTLMPTVVAKTVVPTRPMKIAKKLK